MTAPEFTDEEMIDRMNITASSWEHTAKVYDGRAAGQRYAREARLYRAIAARLSATSGDWQPPEEAERPNGFRCLGSVDGYWLEVEWDTGGSLFSAPTERGWYAAVDSQPVDPTALAPLPPTPTPKVTK